MLWQAMLPPGGHCLPKLSEVSASRGGGCASPWDPERLPLGMQRTWDLGSEWTRGPEETRHTHTNVEDGVFWLGEAWRWPLQSQGSCRPCPIDGGGQGPPVPSEFPGLDPLLPGSVNDCPDLTPALPALPIDTTRGRPRGVLEPREAHGKPSSSCCGGGGGASGARALWLSGPVHWRKPLSRGSSSL